jgi:oligopeptide/dipeptide ABC transporter ATP-binding protein
MSETMLEVNNLTKYFPIHGGVFLRQVAAIHAVDGVSFNIKRGETLGLVGESGCGKTTLSRVALRLIEPTAGTVRYLGRDLFKLSNQEMRKLRLEMAMIFQDPYACLNPRMTLADIVGEPLTIHGLARGEERKRRIVELVKKVGLAPFHMYRYPHEFSGGQKQRIGIARALASNPKFLVADEPVSSLDVSVRAQILNLLEDLQEEFGFTYLYISHDLSTVKHMCDRVAVMYVGKLVELAPVQEIFASPQHPYTEALISAIPIPGRRASEKRIILKGTVPTPIDPPPGCRFNPRCAFSQPICAKEDPEFIETKKGHFVACHLRK